MVESKKSYSGILFALITACGLGSITTQAKIFYADDGNALTLMLTRFVASTLVFGLIVMLQRKSFAVESAHRRSLLMLGLVWSGSMICYLLAVERISVSIAVLLLYLYPLLVVAYATLTRQLKPTPPLIAIFVAAFVGLYLALSGGEVRVNLLGILLGTLAGCGAAFTFVCGARVAPKMSPLVMTFWINATGLLMILPLMPGELRFSASASGAIALGLATLLYLVAILSQFQALARLSAARAAFLLNLEPVVSILMARMLIGEQLNLLQYSGVLLVISMVILSLRFRLRPA